MKQNGSRAFVNQRCEPVNICERIWEKGPYGATKFFYELLIPSYVPFAVGVARPISCARYYSVSGKNK